MTTADREALAERISAAYAAIQNARRNGGLTIFPFRVLENAVPEILATLHAQAPSDVEAFGFKIVEDPSVPEGMIRMVSGDTVDERLARKVLFDFRKRDGLTCYAHQDNETRDIRNMLAALRAALPTIAEAGGEK
jgi:hypothetical protein